MKQTHFHKFIKTLIPFVASNIKCNTAKLPLGILVKLFYYPCMFSI